MEQHGVLNETRERQPRQPHAGKERARAARGTPSKGDDVTPRPVLLLVAGLDYSRLSRSGGGRQAAPAPDLVVGVPLAAPR
ncbi:hypothetical protein NITHO_4170002 [Nitrolancea hollandica Lb]|uniref:Uncharacterized protein n=1 Tax=Nitrolancea hollandica Lb TaxID=1129897 RepID=I4EJN8_9BACT|nr:hypothetical protein NITHO_4170002 [Nitrolancea hollandica Lb]